MRTRNCLLRLLCELVYTAFCLNSFTVDILVDFRGEANRLTCCPQHSIGCSFLLSKVIIMIIIVWYHCCLSLLQVKYACPYQSELVGRARRRQLGFQIIHGGKYREAFLPTWLSVVNFVNTKLFFCS